MSLKTVVTLVLLAFVVIAVGIVVLQSRESAVGNNPSIAGATEALNGNPADGVVAYVGRSVTRPRSVLAAGALYTFGRAAGYVILGALIVLGLASMVSLSAFLQDTFQKLLGPMLILVGMVLLGLLSLPSFGVGGKTGQALQRLVDGIGIWGAVPLGMAFAMSFCPVSAALFFGSLIPLAAQHDSPVLLSSVYGIGTGLPAAGVALLIALGVKRLGHVLERVQVFERSARRVTGVVFILVGVFEVLRGIFGVL
ncbi:MAG: aromatic aminobenezylarsenical efflux permease ArsG family transporter [Thermoanaerobaculia bacterium]